jgi:hypothetical protein
VWRLAMIFATLREELVDSNFKQYRMRRDLISFVAGMMVGAVLGALMGDEDKKRIHKAFNKQTDKLRKEYERPIKEGAAKVKSFVKEYLH